MPLTRDMSDDDQVIENIDRVRCLDFFTAVRQCYSSFNQFHHKYIYGEFASCHKKTDRISHCLKWKMTKDDKHKQALIDNLIEEKNARREEVNTVWEFRKAPPSDW